jgi:hypothetical protein
VTAKTAKKAAKKTASGGEAGYAPMHRRGLKGRILIWK